MSDAEPTDADSRQPFGVPADQGELTPEQQEQAREMAHQLAETRKALLDTEAATVIANHGFGLFELAAIHITTEDPDLDEARLAVDALAALVEGLAGRLGDSEEQLIEALSQIRLAYVQRVHALKQAGDESSDE